MADVDGIDGVEDVTVDDGADAIIDPEETPAQERFACDKYSSHRVI